MVAARNNYKESNARFYDGAVQGIEFAEVKILSVFNLVGLIEEGRKLRVPQKGPFILKTGCHRLLTCCAHMLLEPVGQQ